MGGGTGGMRGSHAWVVPDLEPPVGGVHCLRELGGPFDGFNQSVAVSAPADLGLDRLTAGVQVLLDHHPALRQRLSVDAEGGWHLEVPPPGGVAAVDCVRWVDVAALDDNHCGQLCASRRRRLVGGCVRPTERWFSWYGSAPVPDAPAASVLVLHHLAVDAVT